MDFVSNQQPQFEEMLSAIGVKTIDELLIDIPQKLRLPKQTMNDGLSEFEGMQLMEALAAKNSYQQFENYLGAGAYEHHVPALVGAICSKSEFLTSYTPYQAEASQGMLQVIFEFQTAICAITKMDVANASLYDGASACAEALLMAFRCLKERKKVLVAHSLHPHYRAVVERYLFPHGIEIETIPFLKDGRLDFQRLEHALDETTVALLVQNPNFFGIVDDIQKASALTKKMGALTICCANPLVYGLYHSAKELGVDIAVGDTQPLGIPLQFGGPYAGYIACREELMRQLPGRIVGETVDSQGKRGFVLTLQAREQNIRREKATSNICTNQALAALASLVAILWYGKQGMQKLALTNYQRATYLKNKLGELPRISIWGDAPTFNEFVVKFDQPIELVQECFRKQGIEPGVDLGRFFPELHHHLLIAVTETKNLQQLDRYVKIAKDLPLYSLRGNEDHV